MLLLQPNVLALHVYIKDHNYLCIYSIDSTNVNSHIYIHDERIFETNFFNVISFFIILQTIQKKIFQHTFNYDNNFFFKLIPFNCGGPAGEPGTIKSIGAGIRSQGQGRCVGPSHKGLILKLFQEPLQSADIISTPGTENGFRVASHEEKETFRCSTCAQFT